MQKAGWCSTSPYQEKEKLKLFFLAGLCLGASSKSGPYQGKAQKIPGTLQCAFYDLGGEGVAYHDNDAKNNGSGGLNKADGTYLNEFRMNEGVDISYTKFHDEVDNHAFNKVMPPKDQLYVGWTEPGEWFNLSVQVAKAGNYDVELLYTSNQGGSISFDLDGKKLGASIEIISTNDPKDPVAWRQWHHWNRMTLGEFELPKGRHRLTLRVEEKGNMNFATLEFQPSKAPKKP